MNFNTLSKLICLLLVTLSSTLNSYPKSSYVDDYTWQIMAPHFLPESHFLKPWLDIIFSSSRVTTNLQTLQTAGFQSLDMWKPDKVIVAKHPSLRGYLIKAVLDDQILQDEVSNFLFRIRGACDIQNAIYGLKYSSLFKVPKKWVYPLPDYPPANPSLRRKNFILIVEDMDIVSSSKNENLYYEGISKEHLHGLYHLITLLGLSDSIYIKNIPFTRSGKIAFIDTERSQIWPIHYKKLSQSLNPKMKIYWDKITGEGH